MQSLVAGIQINEMNAYKNKPIRDITKILYEIQLMISK